MSALPNRPKQSSRWGSLLSGAVANLESRLDTFFEEEGNPNRPAPRPRPDGTTASVAGSRPATPAQNSLSRSASASKRGPARQPQDTRTPAPERITSARTSFDVQTSATVTGGDLSTRASLDSTQAPEGEVNELNNVETGREAGSVGEASTAESITHSTVAEDDLTARLSTDTADSTGMQDLEQPNKQRTDVGDLPQPTSEELQVQVAQMKADKETEELQKQEDAQSYLERIDALQAKLQYLAKEAAEAARERAADAAADSMEKKLAAKDEQIALLMEEGQKLSKAEVTHAGTSRKLRQKIADDGKLLADLRLKVAASEKLSTTLSSRVRKLEVSNRDASSKLSKMAQLERDLNTMRSARDEKEATVKYLREQLDTETKRADEAKAKANEEALVQQQTDNTSLREEIANAKAERQSVEGKLRGEIKAAREEMQKEREAKSILEAQMRNEITVLESRHEALRARTEEASAGTGTDSQAKLMRQIETLQTQYSLASENWQGIENTLQSRVTALEKERDDTARSENETRRRAREASNKSRRLQEQLDETSQKATNFEQELTERQAQADKLDNRARQFETQLKEANAKYEKDRQQWQATLAVRIEEEKTKWRQETASFAAPDPSIASVLESPPGSGPKPAGPDLSAFGITKKGMPPRQFSTELSIPSHNERASNRRSYTKPSRMASPSVESGRSTPFLNGSGHEAPSIVAADDILMTESPPRSTINDMISVSTANAGPSVQLVERMSAAVRRLESEKAGTQDELIRLSRQRDEARQEVVDLMGEMEEKRALDQKVEKLQQDLSGVEERYQTTLEMLGERSERVEELEADVADLKQMYRELVQTMK